MSIHTSQDFEPKVKVNHKLGIFTQGKYEYRRVKAVTWLPPSQAMRFEAIVASGATALAGYASVNKQVVAALQLNDSELIQVRFEVLDYIRALIWEQAGQQVFTAKNVHCDIDINSPLWDPEHRMSEFWVLGENRDMNIEIQNPLGYTIHLARTQFWGYRYIVEKLDFSGKSTTILNKLGTADPQTVKDVVGLVTFVNAEGRSA